MTLKKTDYVGAELKNIVASHSNIALDEINTVIEYEEMTNSLRLAVWRYFHGWYFSLALSTLSIRHSLTR